MNVVCHYLVFTVKKREMISKIIKGTDDPLRDIPQYIIRTYDEYPDDCAIDRFRHILSGSKK